MTNLKKLFTSCLVIVNTKESKIHLGSCDLILNLSWDGLGIINVGACVHPWLRGLIRVCMCACLNTRVCVQVY